MTSQPDEAKASFWSVNRIQNIYIYYFKNHAENEAGSLIPDFFLFF